MDLKTDVGRGRRFGAQSSPLLPVAIGLAIGVAVDNGLALGVLVYGAVIGASAIALAVPWVRRRIAWVVVLVAAGGLGGVLRDASFRRVTPDNVVRFVGDSPIIARVRGIVESQPARSKKPASFFARWMHWEPKMRFLLRVQAIEGRGGWVDASGDVPVGVRGELSGVGAGDAVELFGRLYRYRGAMNPGQFDYALWQRRHGIYVGMSCVGEDLVVVEEAGADRWREMREGMRRWARAMLVGNAAAVDDASGLLETMVLGRRRAVDRDIEAFFLRTGTTHFLAVSGAHLGLVAMFAWTVGMWAGGTRRACAWMVVLVVVAYAAIVDPRPPVMRAAVIALTFCGSVILRRSAGALNSLALAAVILLVARPTSLFDVGFQMSFVAVLSIIYLRAPLERAFRWPVDRRSADLEELYPRPARVPGWKGMFLRRYYDVCGWAAFSTAACLASTPIIAFHFGRIAPLGWLYSIVLMPFFGLTLLLGALTVLLGLLTPVVVPVLRWATEWSAEVLLSVVRAADAVSPELRGHWGLVFTGVYLLVLAALAGTVRVGGTTLAGWFRRRLGRRFLPIATVLIVVGVGAWEYFGRRSEEVSLRVTHLAVGRGTAAVIEFPDGRVWLYDCGTNGSYDVGESVVLPFCRARGIRRFDRVFVSHPNLDHFGGLLSVMDGLPTGPVVVNERFERLSSPGGPAAALLAELDRRGHPVRALGELRRGVDFGGVFVEALWPTDDPRGGASTNDSSTVMRMTYQGRSVLMCGDVERAAMDGLREEGDVRADVLVWPHHGSWESNTAKFLRAVRARAYVVSSHRHVGEVLSNAPEDLGLEAGRVFSTVDRGAVGVDIGANGVSVRTFLGGEEFRMMNRRRRGR